MTKQYLLWLLSLEARSTYFSVYLCTIDERSRSTICVQCGNGSNTGRRGGKEEREKANETRFVAMIKVRLSMIEYQQPV